MRHRQPDLGGAVLIGRLHGASGDMIRTSERTALRPHEIVEELRRIAPELLVAGGSFAHWLPNPRDVPSAVRRALRDQTERDATERCLTELLATVGLPAVPPERLPSGARNWPTGHTGSVSHKGTTVLAAIVPTKQWKSVGIDLDRRDAANLPALPGLDALAHPLSVSDADGRDIVFAVWEAAFKALHPVLGRPLGFEEVAVSWLTSAPPRIRGVARACDAALDVRCSIAVPPWIVSAALWQR